MMTLTAHILLGIITGAHGIRGDVAVRSFAGVPEDVAAYGPLTDKAGTHTFRLKVLHVTPKGAVGAKPPPKPNDLGF